MILRELYEYVDRYFIPGTWYVSSIILQTVPGMSYVSYIPGLQVRVRLWLEDPPGSQQARSNAERPRTTNNEKRRAVSPTAFYIFLTRLVQQQYRVARSPNDVLSALPVERDFSFVISYTSDLTLLLALLLRSGYWRSLSSTTSTTWCSTF